MNAVNSVLLFILVWTFTAFCQSDKDVNARCDDVTGSVGKEVTFSCSVSLLCAQNCTEKYKFTYPEIYNDSVICNEQFLSVNSCDYRNSFTCRYTPITAMTEQFRFFVQSICGQKTEKFMVKIPAEIKKKNVSGTSPLVVIFAVVGCVIIVIVIMKVIRNKKPNFNKSCGFQKRMILCVRHDEDNSDHPEDVINYSSV